MNYYFGDCFGSGAHGGFPRGHFGRRRNVSLREFVVLNGRLRDLYTRKWN
ncbi:hypothetical protein COCNU_contig69186851G000010 [Cocos nucifera]|nr:hypothetical protein [Cocos nucifera]